MDGGLKIITKFSLCQFVSRDRCKAQGQARLSREKLRETEEVSPRARHGHKDSNPGHLVQGRPSYLLDDGNDITT